MLDRGCGLRQRLVSRVQVRRVALRIAEVHALDLALDRRLVRQRAEGDDHGAHTVGDADHVARRELVDDRLGGAAQDLVALPGFGRLEDQDDRDRRLLHVLGQLDLDRQRGFQRRPGVAAWPVTVRAADHDQAGTQVPDRCLQQRHAVGAQAGGRDVDQDDGLEGGEIRRRAWQPVGRHGRRADAGRMQGGLEAGRLTQRVFDQQDPWWAHHLDKCLAKVVLGVGIAHRVDHDPHRVEPGLGRFDRLLEGRLTGDQVELNRVDQRAVEIPAHGRPGGGVADDQRLGRGLLALRERMRRVEPIDEGLGAERHRERDRVHPNPLGAQQARLADRVTEVLAAIADDDDVPPAVVGEDRSSELQRGGEVGVVGVRLALELAEVWVPADVDFDLRVAPEAQHAGAVVAVPLLQNAADGGCFAVQRALHAGGKIGHDQQRLGGGRRLDLKSCERRRQQKHDQRAQSEGKTGATRWQGRRKETPDCDDDDQRHDARPQKERTR